MQIGSPCLYLGSFNAEQFWREADISSLPAIADPQADKIVSIMDELQFIFCNSTDDVLITRLPMDSSYKDYLWELGFCFSYNQFPLIELTSGEEKRSPKGICELLLNTENDDYYQDLLTPISRLSPYSIEPFTKKLCQQYGLQCPDLDIEIVKKVNSKLFSHQLAKHLFADTMGEIVYRASDLDAVGQRFLQSSPFLIKDEFGVSGKGNLLISSKQILQRIVTYISKQEREGKHTRFLLEPLLNKQTDFSCQFEIDATGETKILSIQKMQNSGFAFSGIQTAESSFQEFLDRSGYFEQVEAIAAQLHRVGYLGSICLDSMLLQSRKIVPVVEINARKSMGSINHYIDRFLAQFSAQSSLMFFSLGLSHHVVFSEILQRMQQAEILFLKDKPSGILPLASNTLNVNWQLHKASPNPKRTYKGRLYGSVVSNNDEEKERILNTMDNIFADLDIQRLN
ncbi:MAG: hypothetical protein PUP90_24695 [Nostoc sp. S4]|nr:hypothetical protein [Nostoc sp. S4]